VTVQNTTGTNKIISTHIKPTTYANVRETADSQITAIKLVAACREKKHKHQKTQCQK